MGDSPIRLLLCACPPEYASFLPPGIAAASITDWRADLSGHPACDILVVGPLEPAPTVAARHLAAHYPGCLVLIAAANLARTAHLVEAAPFTPLGTRLVDGQNGEELRTALVQLVFSASRKRRGSSLAPQVGTTDATAAMVACYRFYDARREAVVGELAAELRASPELALVVGMAASDHVGGAVADRAARESAAILDGDWGPYEQDLRSRGEFYAKSGLPSSSWLRVIAAFRRILLRRFLEEAEAPVADLQAFCLGLELYTERVIHGIARGYEETSTGDRELRGTRETLHRFVIESSHDAILSMTPDGAVSSWNAAATELFGYREEEMLGRSVMLLVPPERRGEASWLISEITAGRAVANLETQRRHKSGELVDVLLTLSPIRSALGVTIGASSIIRDVSSKLRLERRTAATLEGALDAIITIDQHGVVMEYNPAAEELFGYSAGEAIGKELSTLIIPERSRADHAGGLARYRETGKGRILGKRVELVARRKGGGEFPVEASVVRLPNAEPPVFTGFLRDLTELKKAQNDLRSIIADLRRSNRDLEQFAYVASHDLQEPLRMVTAYMELLQRNYSGQLDAKADKFIGYAVDGAQRMKHLVDDLLDYSRIETTPVAFERHEASSILKSAMLNLRQLLKETGAQVKGERLPAVYGDAPQLTRVFQNLLANAMKFRREQPRIVVSATSTAEWAEFVVADNGLGFEPEHAERIFQMFQRLHPREEYSGSGIGLAVTKRIIERHGGGIWASSTPGEGSAFRFTLPTKPPGGEGRSS